MLLDKITIYSRQVNNIPNNRLETMDDSMLILLKNFNNSRIFCKFQIIDFL